MHSRQVCAVQGRVCRSGGCAGEHWFSSRLRTARRPGAVALPAPKQATPTESGGEIVSAGLRWRSRRPDARHQTPAREPCHGDLGPSDLRVQTAGLRFGGRRRVRFGERAGSLCPARGRCDAPTGGLRLLLCTCMVQHCARWMHPALRVRRCTRAIRSDATQTARAAPKHERTAGVTGRARLSRFTGDPGGPSPEQPPRGRPVEMQT